MLLSLTNSRDFAKKLATYVTFQGLGCETRQFYRFWVIFETWCYGGIIHVFDPEFNGESKNIIKNTK